MSRTPTRHPPRQATRRWQTPRRIALYSHDTQGLGHVRRNSLIAAALVADHPDTDVLLLTGAPQATSLPLPARTDVVTLPSVHKDHAGAYTARALSAPLADVLAMRTGVIEGVLSAFAPDLLIVDKVARGVHGELERPLRRVREQHGTATVLGLRDVLDGAAATRREWERLQTDEAVRSLYDALWVYGDPLLFDPAAEYGWSRSITDKVSYTGYLAHGRSQHLSARTDPAASAVLEAASPFVLGLVGGGQDGAAVARAFAAATYPAGHSAVLITGPYLGTETLAELRNAAAVRDDLHVLDFVADVPSFVARSSACVSMGGYNSVCELLAAGVPSLLVPRTTPRTEQAVRAERLRRAAQIDVAAIASISAADVTEWLGGALRCRRSGRSPFDLDGLARVPRLADALLEHKTAAAEIGVMHHAAV
ncbi:MAG TPA: glycosyltransferase [Nocardioidaceae bacterium]|nr:glycosyltransferase [Nocardioidaceae bacterium]